MLLLLFWENKLFCVYWVVLKVVAVVLLGSVLLLLLLLVVEGCEKNSPEDASWLLPCGVCRSAAMPIWSKGKYNNTQ